MSQISDFKKFVLRGMIFFALVFSMDFVLGSIFEYYFFRTKSGADYRCISILNNTKSDILILGSSRASHHYNTILLSDTLNLSCFNGGRDGHFFLYNAILAMSVIERYSPKCLVFDLEALQMTDSLPNGELLSDLLPFYDNDEVIRSALDTLYPYSKLASCTKLIRYNSKLLSTLKGLFIREDLLASKGFQPLFGSMDDNKAPQKINVVPKVSQFSRKILMSLIHKAKQRNTNLVFVQSPRYLIYNNQDLRECIYDNKGSFFETECNQLFLSMPYYFKDPSHLNVQGANVFTRHLVSRLSSGKNI